jgi:hypothetical protein
LLAYEGEAEQGAFGCRVGELKQPQQRVAIQWQQWQRQQQQPQQQQWRAVRECAVSVGLST